jgi:hypothetical protein
MNADSPLLVTHQQPLPDIDSFRRKTDILSRIDDIHGFSFAVQYQKSGALSSPAAQDALLGSGYSVLNELLETSGIHYLHALEAKPKAPSAVTDEDEPQLQFVFGHDTQHCAFQFFDDRFVISRRASSFEDFYAWYRVVMPEALRIEMTFRQIVHRATQRSLRPVQAAYEFTFYFSDFKKPKLSRIADQPQREWRNMDVLEEIIRQLPGPNREMTKLTDQQLYRLDLTVSKRDFFGPVSREVWYSLQAPFNEKGRFIVLKAQLRNTSAEILENGEVRETTGFDPDFASDYRLAILDFLKDRALEGFVWQLLGDWEFSTERGL